MGMMTERQVAARLHVSVALVRRWRQTGEGPTYRKIGRAVRYESNDVEQWIATRPTGCDRCRRSASKPAGARISLTPAVVSRYDGDQSRGMSQPLSRIAFTVAVAAHVGNSADTLRC
jgi:predicted DNA-binding transcriptional regulator AlpA